MACILNRESLHELIQKEQPNICQVFAYKDGEKVYSDEWNDYKQSDCTHVMSVTKSIVSLLVGIALDQGFIKSIDDKVLDYFPDYKVKRGEKTIYDVTIRHLLTMKAPYKCKGDPWTKVCTSANWTVSSLDFLGGRKGITNEFKYQTVCLHILTGILSKVTGMTTVDYANQVLFEPIGVKKHYNYCAKSAEEHIAFTRGKTPKDKVWFCDPQGIGTAGYGLCLSAEDMAKIGLLCLNKGEFSGKQIVSSKWIDTISTPTYTAGREFRNMMYGYLWWVIKEDKSIYAAIGNSGNVIYVDQKNKVVIAVTSYFKPTVFDRVDFIEDVMKPFILEY